MEKILFHPVEKNRSTMVERFFSTYRNDLVLVDKDINPSKD